MLVGGGRLVAALIALISIRAVTTFLSPEQFGELALLITVQVFCGLFLINPVGQHINLHTHAWWDDGTLSARLKYYQYYVLAVSLVGGFAVLGISTTQSVEQLIWGVIAMVAMVIASTWNATLIPILNMLGFRATSVLWSVATVMIALVASILLVTWLPTPTAWFAGQAIGMGAGALGANYVLRQHTLQSQSFSGILPLLNKSTVITYCLPLALATGFMWMQLGGYRFLIEHYWGLAPLGFLVVGLQLAGQLFSLAESLAMQFLYAMFFRRVSANENKVEVKLAFSDLLNTLVPIYLVLAGLLILSAPYLLKVLVSSQYQNSVKFVMLGAGIELCRVLGNLVSNAAHVQRKTKSLTFPYVIGALTTLGLIYFVGAEKMDISWVAIALLLGAMAMLITMVMSMYQQINFSLDSSRCFSAGVVMVVMSFLAMLLPEASGVVAAIGMLILTTIPAIIIVLALLWKNPATLRLINVQLRNN